MSVLTTTPMTLVPAAAAGITVVASATPWASGSWVELIAATGAATVIAGIKIVPTTSYSGLQCEIAFGVGAAASEVEIGHVRLHGPTTGSAGTAVYMLPVPISGIGTGVRVSVRSRSAAASTSLIVTALVYVSLDSQFTADYPTAPLSSRPDGAAGASITPSGTGWANSSWVELDAALAMGVSLVGLAFLNPVADVDIEFELGTGGAGAETAVTVLRASTWGASTGPLSYATLPGPYVVTAGTRLAIRMRKTGTSTTAYSVAAILLEGVPSAAGRVWVLAGIGGGLANRARGLAG